VLTRPTRFRRAAVTRTLRLSRSVLRFGWVVSLAGASAVVRIVARARRPRRQGLPKTRQEGYHEIGQLGYMETAVRPEVAAEPSAGGLSVEVRGEELQTVLALLEKSRKHDPEDAQRLKRAKDLALHVIRTGHLPASA